MIIDATNLLIGRMASVLAKKALLGEKIDIVNCEKAVISGGRANVLARYRQKADRGIPLKGPYFPNMPDRLVRRTIRGMLPYKQEKGRKAFERVMCYIGVPMQFKDKRFETVKEANVDKLPNMKFATVADIAKQLGAKI